MPKRCRVSIVCGGRSVEHAVSLRSAQFIANSFDEQRYEVSVVVVCPQGRWRRVGDIDAFIACGDYSDHCEIMPAIGRDDVTWQSLDGAATWLVDVVFPLIHGTSGEDGCLQGLLRWLDVAFVGSDVLGSSICMDKWVAKQLLEANGIATAPWYGLSKSQWQQQQWPDGLNQLNYPLFVKPVDLGSSVGISKVLKSDALDAALAQAFEYADRVIIESMIDGREIECAVLGNDSPQASMPGELQVHADFYDYAAKYVNAEAADIVIPAALDADVTDRVRVTAIKTYQALLCQGLARVDCFVTDTGEIIVNEVNTLPGFTQISMYPKMWQHMGVNASVLMDQLVDYALARHQQQQRRCVAYPYRVNSEIE